jgi:dsRNA-gated channel SID-1
MVHCYSSARVCTIHALEVRVLSKRVGVVVLVSVTLVVIVAAILAPRIAQPLSYHNFADRRAWLGIPNLGDVVSNAGFAIAGLWGLVVSFGKPAPAQFVDSSERWTYATVFAGMVLTAIGSAYYHLAPDNDRLVWDRLPMTIVFMALVVAMIIERISVPIGLALLPILLLVGIASVVQWHISELNGASDLRFYVALQLYAVLLLLVILLLPPRYTRSSDLVVVVGFYVLAKITEAADRPIFAFGHVVSGHTIKHLAAAAAGLWILRMLQKRRPVELPASA